MKSKKHKRPVVHRPTPAQESAGISRLRRDEQEFHLLITELSSQMKSLIGVPERVAQLEEELSELKRQQ